MTIALLVGDVVMEVFGVFLEAVRFSRGKCVYVVLRQFIGLLRASR